MSLHLDDGSSRIANTLLTLHKIDKINVDGKHLQIPTFYLSRCQNIWPYTRATSAPIIFDHLASQTKTYINNYKSLDVRPFNFTIFLRIESNI